MKKAFLNLFTAEGRRHEVPTSIYASKAVYQSLSFELFIRNRVNEPVIS